MTSNPHELQSCGDILTKKKLDPHRNRCHGATFTCIDCMVHFFGTDYRSHTSCMTEEQKYQGALYKDKNKKPKTQNGANQQRNNNNNMMAQHAYVEDVEESWANYQDFGQTDDEKSPAELLPEAPTPPAAISDDKVDVFEFLVASQTPNASNLELPQEPKVLVPTESTSLVRYEGKPDDLLDPTSFMDDDEGLPQYGDSSFETPAPSRSERKKHKDGVKGDKKRKRLHVDIPSDQDMTDAPPVLHHSGLTGGLKGMMKAHLPPPPDYSGDDGSEPLPTSPLKKTKHSKNHKHGQVSNSLFGMLSAATKSSSKSSSSKTKTKKRKTSSSSSKKHSSSKHSKEKSPKSPKLIGYQPKGEKGEDSNQMVVFRPRADLFFDFVDKGPESERGCSMNKALKRFHRERKAAGTDMTKHMEEKELWRSIRLRRNEQGEIVLFSIES
ncbi:unnamed protein product [Clonostachys chloroleuca]|uniref:Zinc finger C2H2 LYAR-type domain-containing protein n=1 Tax=Clonostachys chloroleuca TaxID=1926264 RepID=A0AA35MEK3_9HYPO|nr:unnamed protein product [Clonostachys chloroleuca]